MTEQRADESSTTPFWYVLGLMMFWIALFFLAALFEHTIGLFDLSHDFQKIQKLIFGGLMNSIAS